MGGELSLLKLVLGTHSIEQLALDDCQLYQHDLEELAQLQFPNLVSLSIKYNHITSL